MLSLHNAVTVNIPSCSRVMAFSNNCTLICSNGKGFSIGNGGTGEPSISDEEMNPLITLWVAI